MKKTRPLDLKPARAQRAFLLGMLENKEYRTIADEGGSQ